MIEPTPVSTFANRLDFHLYQDSLYLVAFLLAAGLGMLLAALIWPADEERCREIEWENRRLEADGATPDKA
jgi:hypothetical protein